MLKIKSFFLLFFVLIFLSFTSIFYFINEGYISNIVKNTYLQKLKTLDDVLRFSLLENLNNKNLKELSAQTRADFVVQNGNEMYSSLENFNFFKNQFEANFTSDFLNHREIFYKAYAFKNFKYIIIVYPKMSEQVQFYWRNNALIFVLFMTIVLLFSLFIFNYFKYYFNEIINFIKQINKKENFTFKKSLFKDLNFLNSRFLKIQNLYFKQELKSKKQAKKIKTKNIQLSNVISAISHELKNPLSVIDLSLQSLKDETQQSTRVFLLDKIQKQSFKINQLTDKLNLIFNLNVNSLHLESFDLFTLSKEVILGFDEPRLKLVGEETRVRADIFLIEQVIVNLISNALKYSKKDIIIQVREKEFKITDQGIGIDSKDLKFITKKFYKINSQSNNSFGLGLFLVKKILILHQSYLKIESRLNLGSTFSFKLS